MECISNLTKTAEKVIDGFCNDYVKTRKSLANYQMTLVNNMTTLHKVLEDIRLLDTAHSKLRQEIERGTILFKFLLKVIILVFQTEMLSKP